MDKILERIKGLDKRILIGTGIVLVAVIVLIIFFAVGGNKPANDNDTSNETEYETGTEDETSNAISTEESTETEDATETELSTEDVTEVEDEVDGGNTEINDGQSQTGTVNPDGEEILGVGNESDPFLEILGEDNTVSTVEIAPGKTAYYGIYRVGGMCLTIEDADAYVIYEGKKYDAKNGKVSFQVKNELASEAVYFGIGNNGNSAKSFTLKFANVSGSYANPENISSMGTYNKSLPKGSETGHYYKYVAEKTGTIRFYIDSATNECEMSVTNNATSINKTFEEDVQTDSNGKSYIELSVTKGDTLMIQIFAKPDKRWTYPATDITWSGIYQ